MITLEQTQAFGDFGDFGRTEAEVLALVDTWIKTQIANVLHVYSSKDISYSDVRQFLTTLPASERSIAASYMVAKGVQDVDAVMNQIKAAEAGTNFGKYATIFGVLSTVSMAVSAYHGYKRNNSIGWGLAWGAMGTLFPVITPVFAIAQGYGKPRGA